MKALFVIGILLIPFMSFAQGSLSSNTNSSGKKSTVDYFKNDYSNLDSQRAAGLELQKGANQQFLGISIGVVGGIVGGVVTATDPSPAGGIVIIGTSIASLILNISAWKHIKTSGVILESNRMTYSGNKLSFNLN